MGISWGEIIGGGITGGLIGYTEERQEDLAREEKQAREDGLAQLKRKWQIEDREWEQRMRSDEDARRRAEKKADLKENRDYKAGLLDEKRAYDEKQALGERDWLAERDRLSDERKKGLVETKASLKSPKDYPIRPQDKINAQKEISESYSNYEEMHDPEMDGDKLGIKEWAYINRPGLAESAYGAPPSQKGTGANTDMFSVVKQLIDNEDREGLAEYRKSIENDPSKLKQFNQLGKTYIQGKRKPDTKLGRTGLLE